MVTVGGIQCSMDRLEYVLGKAVTSIHLSAVFSPLFLKRKVFCHLNDLQVGTTLEMLYSNTSILPVKEFRNLSHPAITQYNYSV